MEQYRIEITKLAEEDMENAGDYIAYELRHSPAAENIVRGIRKKINFMMNSQ